MLYITIRRRLQRAWFHFFSLSPLLLYKIELNISCLVFNKIAAVCACENLVFASTESRQIWVRFPSSPSLGRCNRLHACNRGPGFLAKVYSSFLFSDYRVTCPLWIDLPLTPDLIFAVTSIWTAMQWYQFVFILTHPFLLLFWPCLPLVKLIQLQ